MTDLMRVTAVDYETENGEVLVQLAGRGSGGERMTRLVEDTTPYFYAPEQERVPESDAIVNTSLGYESYDGKYLQRIETHTPKQSGNLAKEFQDPHESDIPFYRRASIDYNLSGHIRVPATEHCSIDDIEREVEVEGDEIIKPRVFVADIEVLQTSGSIEELKENADSPVSHITVWDSFEDEYVVLHLDQQSEVKGKDVKSHLDEHARSESLLTEMERDIRLRRFKSEEALLSGFISLFEERRPDLVSGWNFVNFDWEYLLARFEKFGDLNEHRLSDVGYINGYQTERKVDCVPAFDMLQAYKKIPGSDKRSWSLDYVAKDELGIGKIPDIDINWAFANEKSRLVAYNIMDVMLCVALDRRDGIHEFFYELAELSQIQVYDTFSEMRLVDGYIMSNGGDSDILPPQSEKDIPENAGGLVLNPSDGVQEWVGVHDLKSLYPSVMITWNISPETIQWHDGPPPTQKHINVPWLPDADSADGGQFTMQDIDFDVMWSDLTTEGLMPRMLKRMFPEREQRKKKRDEFDPDDPLYDVWDRRQSAVKVIMNSFYGVSSNDYWRLGREGLGDAITSAARFALWKGKEICEDTGLDVIYGDTDSVMVNLVEEGEGMGQALVYGKELEDIINDRMEQCVDNCGLGRTHPFLDASLHGTRRHCLVYEFEKLYRRFFQAGSKKRYAGLIVWKEGKQVDGKIDTVGFESQRSDSPELTSQVQPDVIRRILEGESFDEVSEYIRGLIQDIETGEMDLYRVALPATINKPLHEYGNTQTAKACRFSNKNLDGVEWRQGDDPWVYFIDRTPPMTPDTEVLALDWDEDLPEGYELDLDKTLERGLKGPLSPILDEVNWRFTELKMGAETQSAADFDGNWEQNESTSDSKGPDQGDKWDW